MKLRKLINRLIDGGKLPEPLEPWETGMTEEGVIVLDGGDTDFDNKWVYRWQAGGVSCDHPEASGKFYPCRVPNRLKKMFRSGESALASEVEKYVNKKGLRVNIDAGSQEAWLYGTLEDGKRVVIAYNNSD